MHRRVSTSFLIRRPVAPSFFPLVATLFVLFHCGCTGDPAAPGAALVAVADVEILNLHSTNPDQRSYATCQTGAAVLLKAYGSHDPSGQPLVFEWRDEVDFGDGIRLPSHDWGLESNLLRTTEESLATQFSSVAFHYVTLTVRARDGRSASETLRITVTACESCGTP